MNTLFVPVIASSIESITTTIHALSGAAFCFSLEILPKAMDRKFMKAGGKAAGKKIEDPGRDTSSEYNKEKVKEKVEDL